MPRGTSTGILLKNKRITTGLIASCNMKETFYLLFSQLNINLHSVVFPHTQHMCEGLRLLHSSGHTVRVKYLETHSETPAVQTREEKKSPESGQSSALFSFDQAGWMSRPLCFSGPQALLVFFLFYTKMFS